MRIVLPAFVAGGLFTATAVHFGKGEPWVIPAILCVGNLVFAIIAARKSGQPS